MGFGGIALRALATTFYGLEFCCAAIILGIYSYFLSVLADRDEYIPRDFKAVEGISGIAVVYTIFAVVLTFCLGGARFFALLAVILDVAFVGAFIALAVLTRAGAHSCTGVVSTPLGRGGANVDNGSFNGQVTYQASFGLSCRLNKAAFAVSVIGAFLFVFSALLQVWVSRHHQREKKEAAAANEFAAAGEKRRFWQRKQKNVEAGGVGAHY